MFPEFSCLGACEALIESLLELGTFGAAADCPRHGINRNEDYCNSKNLPYVATAPAAACVDQPRCQGHLPQPQQQQQQQLQQVNEDSIFVRGSPMHSPRGKELRDILFNRQGQVDSGTSLAPCMPAKNSAPAACPAPVTNPGILKTSHPAPHQQISDGIDCTAAAFLLPEPPLVAELDPARLSCLKSASQHVMETIEASDSSTAKQLLHVVQGFVSTHCTQRLPCAAVVGPSKLVDLDKVHTLRLDVVHQPTNEQMSVPSGTESAVPAAGRRSRTAAGAASRAAKQQAPAARRSSRIRQLAADADNAAGKENEALAFAAAGSKRGHGATTKPAGVQPASKRQRLSSSGGSGSGSGRGSGSGGSMQQKQRQQQQEQDLLWWQQQQYLHQQQVNWYMHQRQVMYYQQQRMVYLMQQQQHNLLLPQEPLQQAACFMQAAPAWPATALHFAGSTTMPVNGH